MTQTTHQQATHQQTQSLGERALLHFAATELLNRYQALVDAKDLAGLADVVTDDVELVRVQGSGRGRETFLDVYRAFVASDVDVAQHMVSNVRVSPLVGGAQRVDACFWVVTTHEAGGVRQVWGRYRDDMVATDDGWRLSAKRIQVIRTAVVPEEALMPLDATSFGPLPD